MQEYIPGQRWISDTELQMGLGTVLTVEFRTITVLFIATGETRTYAKQTAPLTRVIFAPGDTVESHEGWKLRITAVEEYEGLFTYVGLNEQGDEAGLEEGQLSSFLQLNRPTQRMFNGQIDRDHLFELRYQTLQQQNRLSHSELRGLLGARTSPIPHQLYIAHEVANRYAPRVLLADEVGLGKTIEAGLILHHQLLSERARRVLIVLPESLMHQWLVEMVRRFNLRFSLFDEARCLAIEESSGQSNPFQSEQLVLCDLNFLADNPNRLQQALEGEWDLLVVDEAHHLEWSPQQPSRDYTIVEQLAAETKGVLLLTATPEQLGKESHFARLRLLDPDRFHSFEQFVEEEQHYAPIATAVEALLNNQPLTSEIESTLAEHLDEGDNRQLLTTLQSAESSEAEQSAARTALVEHLLDRHGTGRVLLRNTRAAVKGFPERHLNRYPLPLPLPQPYAACLEQFQGSGLSEPQLLLSPELLYSASSTPDSQHWCEIDPRIEWLQKQLKSLKPEKVLVITASADSALDIADALRIGSGIHAGVFHEGMSIIERDRAAAYFADNEAGSQVLICSEIGSEGRNFQFAHHLVLFDLPLNPDLLEQRIGRLDRIGQHETIEIHVPYLEQSPQAVMQSWYHEGLGAFEQTCPAGHSVFVQVETTLVEALHQIDEGLEDLPALIATTSELHRRLNEALQQGRDRLLEYNSCRPHIANGLKDQVEAIDDETALDLYLDGLFDAFGVESELHTSMSTLIRPGQQMQAGALPGLTDEGMVITTDRDTALSNEDMQFISWEHPMISSAMEGITSSELGNTSVTSVNYPSITAGTLLIESLYLLESSASSELQAGRYLPPTTIRIVIDQHGKLRNDDLPHEAINDNRERVKRGTANQIIKAYKSELEALIEQSEKYAEAEAPQIIAEARTQTEQMLHGEIERLTALQQVNPNVRREEIEFFEQQLAGVNAALESATVRLDAQRIIITT
ncbi:RNA polymerase-binding ATPase [Solemya pervernicosa gill symbiont]|uniref:RNA polymerase-associated protein RapA n=2 Tax=Gammaproteobacteria incertae sedis TaxID=118884 RepID=A0A1T2L2T7_9GAMM|nr:RNA polymerase-associated protein RapA [Candidatus Reidiella endopervernicosa]OOZ39391.1 RNA polymerase-binding ATPase [Solemya pervernicosa gill symbiont]QKQ25335.1 RNA polymerase-associated protein RapA [Candidatus Reidiella endopervernicosa]